MADSFIKIQIEGSEEENGDVRLNDFIEELTALKNALKITEKSIIHEEVKAIGYRVIDLSHSSPATVTIGITSKDPVYSAAPRKISRRLTTTLSMVRRAHRYASQLDQRTLDTFRELTSPSKKHIARLVVTDERNRAVSIDKIFKRSLESLAQTQEVERDEICGRLERLDIHNKTTFDIFPLIGPTSIRCVAPPEFSEEIIRNAGKWVSVDGWVTYRKSAPYPTHIRVEAIYPQESLLEMPRLTSLHNIPQETKHGEKAEDFVRGIRDASW